jgi:hypothetical protein
VHLKHLYRARYASQAKIVHLFRTLSPHPAPHAAQQHCQFAPAAAKLPVTATTWLEEQH